MKKFRDLISRPSVTVALFALALVLLGGSTVGGARAALTVESQYYNSQVQTSSIDVALLENGAAVSGEGALFSKLLGEDESLKIGKKYDESLAVQNTGSISEYVRVSVYQYWMDEQGNKVPEMDSQWIKLGFVTGGGWTIDEDSSTEERTVLYYADPLDSGASSSPFLNSVTIDERAARTVTQTGETEITTTYVYNGKSFCVEVHVDGVQTHNADQAKLSAWGVNK
ncbi:MAG: hypothetical protein II845_03185 [Oscillospiraceae bacterium]|nr:hypothetical protein [Oscillospiraceae bacterium]